MPTYEYECRACGHHFDVFQSITAKPLRKCVKCGKSRARRMIGRGAGIIFKGSGFYQTDYRSDHYRKQSAAEKSDSAPAKAKDVAKEAAKPVAPVKSDKASGAAKT